VRRLPPRPANGVLLVREGFSQQLVNGVQLSLHLAGSLDLNSQMFLEQGEFILHGGKNVLTRD
jgi:hypothetical protein